MKNPLLQLLSVASLCTALTAQGTDEASARETIAFDPPQRIQAGSSLLGAGRLYPSPVLHDVDGDGLQDIVLGDLFGRMTYAPRLAEDGVRYGAEISLKDRSGEQLTFHNW